MLPLPPRSTLFPYTTLFRSGIEFAADEPFPEGRVAGVEGLAPGFVPMEEGSVMVEAFRKMLFAEFFDEGDRKSTRLNSSHRCISYAVFCLKKKKKQDSTLLI